MPNTVEDIKKQVSDAGTAAAVAALEAQVDKARASYANMNKGADMTAAEGKGFIENRMQSAGLERPVTDTANLMLQSAAGNAKASNDQAQRLGEMNMQGNIRFVAGAGQQNADKMAKQQAQQKAATLAQYGDFSGYGELGYSPEQVQGMKAVYDAENNKPEDYEGLSNYAMTLLDLYETNANFDIAQNLKEALDNGLITQRDYQAALIASRGIVAGSKAKKDKGTGTKGSNMTAAEKAAAERVTTRTPEGKYIVHEPGDWETLMGYYTRNGMLNQFATQFVYRPRVMEDDLAYVPGYGNITWEEADALERAGLVKVTKDAKGQITFVPKKMSDSNLNMVR